MRGGKQGRWDKGDFFHTAPFVIEAKNQKALDLAGWMDEARVEAKNAGGLIPVVMFPRKSMALERCYVLMELGDWIDLAPLWAANTEGILERRHRGSQEA
jgi:hypothetical protein